MILSWSQSWAARNQRYSDTVITKNNDFSIYIRLDKIRYILERKYHAGNLNRNLNPAKF